MAGGQEADCNSNGVPDSCEAQGDLDGNGVVGLSDFLTFTTCFGLTGPVDGQCASELFVQCDFERDNRIDLQNFNAFAVYFGACSTGPPGP